MYAYKFGYASAGGNVSVDNENLAGRQIAEYAGITTTLSSAIATKSTESISITGITNLDINIGDYLEIGSGDCKGQDNCYWKPTYSIQRSSRNRTCYSCS